MSTGFSLLLFLGWLIPHSVCPIDEGGDDTAVTDRSRRRRQTPKAAVAFAWICVAHVCNRQWANVLYVGTYKNQRTHANLGTFRGIGFIEMRVQRTRFELASWGADDDQTGTRISSPQVREGARKMSMWVSACWLFFMFFFYYFFLISDNLENLKVVMKLVFKLHTKFKKKMVVS